MAARVESARTETRAHDMAKHFKPLPRPSTWRRLALHAWRPPSDPSVYSLINLDMTRALAYLDDLAGVDNVKDPTVTHLVVKALARAIAAYPESNAIIARRRIYLRSTVDIYCQVSTDEGRGLSGVKITAADRLSVQEIARQLSTQAAAVRRHEDAGSESTIRLFRRLPAPLLRLALRVAGYLSYDLRLDLGGFGIPFDQFGSAMVSNVGVWGVENALAPLVPPSRVPIVLLVGQVQERPIVRDGRIVAAPCATLGATFDHRILDGYQSSAMLRVLKAALEDPAVAFGPATLSNSTAAARS